MSCGLSVPLIVSSQQPTAPEPLELKVKNSLLNVRPLLKKKETLRFFRSRLLNKSIRIKILLKNHTNHEMILYYFNTELFLSDNSAYFTQFTDTWESQYPKFRCDSTFLSDGSNSITNQNLGLFYTLQDSLGKVVKKNRIYSKHIRIREEGQRRYLDRIEHHDKRWLRNLKNKWNYKFVNRVILDPYATKKQKLILHWREYYKSQSKESVLFSGYLLPKGKYYLYIYHCFVLDSQLIDPEINNRYFNNSQVSKRPIHLVIEDIEDNNIDKCDIFQGIVRSNRVTLIVK